MENERPEFSLEGIKIDQAISLCVRNSGMTEDECKTLVLEFYGLDSTFTTKQLKALLATKWRVDKNGST